jgi:hypothetical protein
VKSEGVKKMKGDKLSLAPECGERIGVRGT